MAASNVDLRQLVVDRAGAEPPRRRGHLLTRVGLPVLLLVGFLALVAYAARESFASPRSVTVVPVLPTQGEVDLPADTQLFRAAGWVEPRPAPTLVTAQAEGVVEELLVLEGQEVKAGEVVARLVDAEARLAVTVAEADVKLRRGELSAASAAHKAARVRLAQPLHLKVELAEAEAALAKTETELATLPALLRAAQSRRDQARADWESKQRGGGAIPDLAVARARSEAEAAGAVVEELQARQKHLPVEVAALAERRDALKLKLDRKTDETQKEAEAAAAVVVAEARCDQAEAALATARLRREWMVVRSPTAGRVLALTARRGMRLSGLNPGSLHDSSTVLTLYDPAHLQVRVDVRLDDVGKVQVGQKARIESAAVPGGALEGRVLLVTSQADVQKNTLSVKVAISDPPAALRPDMLCQVTFLAVPRPEGAPSKSGGPSRLMIPRQLVEQSGDGGKVWLADRLTGTARLRSVRLGVSAGELVEVTEGLSPSDRLIVDGRDGLRDGDRIQVAGEDQTLGLDGRRARQP